MFEFNRIVGIDAFQVNFLGHPRAFLNEHRGPRLQLPGHDILGPSSEGAWRGHSSTTLLGPARATHLRQRAGHFSRKLEQSGTSHRVTDADSPWQSGRVERHGRWVQDLMDKAVEEVFVGTESELEAVS